MLHRRLLWLTALGITLRHSACVLAVQVNVTIDDMDPSFVFSPSDRWFASNNASGCAFCLAPENASLAFDSTWHHGLHIIPIFDNDDESSPSSATVATASTGDGDNDGDDGQNSGKGDTDNDGGNKGSSQSGKGKGKGKRMTGRGRSLPRSPARLPNRRRAASVYETYYAPTSTQAPAVTNTASPFFTEKFDSDDPQFVDIPVFVQFNFSGNAVYVNCLLPLSLPPTQNSTPTLTNLTFTLDGQQLGTFLHNGSAQDSGFQPNATVFAQEGLAPAQHTLRIDLGPDSVFLLDAVVFTQGEALSANSTSSGGGTSAVPDTSSNTSTNSDPKNHNVATFGGVLGGVGVLAVAAIITAVSIIHRRRRSAKRIARERDLGQTDAESFHTFEEEDDADTARPQMRGLAPLTSFVPRFFPNTVPSIPPQYAPPAPAMTEDSTDVPPPFAVAILEPEPPLLASVMRRPLDQLSPPTFDQLPSAESSDMEEVGMSTPLILASARRRSRPPSFRSTRSEPVPGPEPPSSPDASDSLSADGRNERVAPPHVEESSDHTSHENNR